jgi:hypothetical protein
MQYTSHIPHTTTIHSHIHNLLFDVWDSPLIHLVEQKCVASTLRVLTEKALLSIRGLAVLDHLSRLAGRTRNRLQHHQRPSAG